MSGGGPSTGSGGPRSTRSPPGLWRVLAPALLAWACAAVAVLHPGTGRVLAGLAGAAGTVLVVLSVQRWQPLRRVARRALRCSAVSCAVLVLVGAGLESGERARADPGLARAAEQQRTLEFEAVLRGFPQVRISGAQTANGREASRNEAIRQRTVAQRRNEQRTNEQRTNEQRTNEQRTNEQRTNGQSRAWAEAELGSASGPVPVVLWMDGEAAASSGAADATAGTGASPWAPGARLVVRGTLVPLGPGSAAAYGVRVEAARAAPASGAPGLIADAGRAAAALRTQLREAAAAVPGAALVPGFAVGDTALVDDALERRMQQSSLTHLVAVSGDTVDTTDE